MPSNAAAGQPNPDVPIYLQIREAADAIARLESSSAIIPSEAQSHVARLIELAEQVKPMERFCDEIAQQCAEQARLDAAAALRRAAIATGRVVDLAQRRPMRRPWPFQGGAA